jgi:hypothetical protein
MDKLSQAMEILAKPSLSLADAKALSRLEVSATGEEAEMIGELWEAFYVAASPELLEQLYKKAL